MLTPDEQSLAAGYSDNFSSEALDLFLSNSEEADTELQRLNEWRCEERDIHSFTRIIKEAVIMQAGYR